MDKERIRQHLLDFHEREIPNVKNRDYKIQNSRKIVSLIGGRSVGKTYLMYQKMKSLIDEGVESKKIIYLNFENPVLNEAKPKEFREILEIWFSIFPEIQEKKLYLFIDEPQAIEKWELGVRDLYDNFNSQIFISGSSSKLLSKEISTSLRGRSISKNIYPLTFKEFLNFKNEEIDLKKLSTKSKIKAQNLFKEYLSNGGYPEVVLENDKNEINKITKSYYDLIIYRDLIERYHINNTQLMKWLINYFITSAPKEVSANKIFNNLKSRGYKLSKNTLYEYMSILEDSFFVHFLKKHTDSIKKQESNLSKAYLGDISFMNIFSEENHGKRLENIIFTNILALLERNYSFGSVSLWKSSKECDFLVKERNKVKEAIQVCHKINDENREREIAGLLEPLEEFELKEGTILTMNQEETLNAEGKKVNIKPAWKWLLEKLE
ncbi:MAG: ATP-binding protein [Candidatus Pacearchaeota archaeon]